MAVGLAMIAGYVDAYAFITYRTYVSFMSGNTTQTDELRSALDSLEDLGTGGVPSYDDPGWYEHPKGTIAAAADRDELRAARIRS